MKKQTGGPAFPVPHPYEEHSTGMTLRDWFAGQAIQRVPKLKWPDEIATMAYELADALLEEREK